MARPKALHKDGDCESLTGDGALCSHWGMYKMTRIDGTSQVFCTRHRNLLDAVMQKRPESFNPVKWTTIK